MIDDVGGGVRDARYAPGGWGRHSLDRRKWAIEAVEDPVELDSHLIRERPPGVVIRRNGRTARILEVVRVILRLEHVEHVRPEGLRRLHDVGSSGVALAAYVEGRRGAVDRHADLDQRVDELRRGREVWLIRRQDVATRIPLLRRAQCAPVLHGKTARTDPAAALRVRTRRLVALCAVGAGRREANALDVRGGYGPVIPASTLDGVPSHLVDVVEELLAVPRGDVEHGLVRRDGIVHGLTELPRARRHRCHEIAARQLPLREEGNLDRRRIADRLREQPNHVVEVHRRPEPAIPPRGIVRASPRCGARLLLEHETIVHRRTDEVDAGDDEWIVEVVEGIAERRREQHRARRAGLMVIVHDLREPLAEQHARHVLRLGLRDHVEVTVVVVPDVFLIEARNARRRAFGLLGTRMYQSETSSIPSGFAWTASTMTSSRNRNVSASVPLTSCHTVSSSCWAPSTSVACRPPSIQTTAFPSAARRRASSSLSPSASASRRAISL